MTSRLSALIDVSQLITLAGDAQLRIFDCRHDLGNADAGVKAYAAGHLPGATHLHLDTDLSGPRTGLNGRHPLPDRAKFCGLLSGLGITADTQIVAYDDSGGIFAARLWWLMRWLGHERVAVLDGGLAAWRQTGLPLTGNQPVFTPAVYHAPSLPLPAMPTVDAGYIGRHLGQPGMLILDARSPDRFRGENETMDPVGGHIPGAVNHFFRDNLNENGRFKAAAELEQFFQRLLRTHSPEQVVHQCGSGVTACHNLLAMEYAGLSGSRLYPGSWSEWCSDPARPVAKGPA